MKYVYGRKFGRRAITKRYGRFGRNLPALLAAGDLKKKPDRIYCRFLTRYGGKIVSRHVSGLKAKQQKAMAKCIKRARVERAIPYFVNRTLSPRILRLLRSSKYAATLVLARRRKVQNFVKRFRARKAREKYLREAGLWRGRFKPSVVGQAYEDVSETSERQRQAGRRDNAP
jgi:ribosomal protein S18